MALKLPKTHKTKNRNKKPHSRNKWQLSGKVNHCGKCYFSASHRHGSPSEYELIFLIRVRTYVFGVYQIVSKYYSIIQSS